MDSVYIHSFNEYLDAIKKYSDLLEDDEELFYRGVSDCSYDLRPGILFEKSCKEDEAYHSLILEYPEEFNTKEHLSTLAKMQHYGLPTRLLDLSNNILTSLYFACEQKHNDADGQVFVFKEKKKNVLHHNSDRALMLACLPVLNDKVKDEITEFCKTHNGVIDDQQIAFNDSMKKFLHEIRGEYPAFETAIVGQDILDCFIVKANKSNVRMKTQSGFFAIFGLDYEHGVKKLEDLCACKIIIDKDCKKEILKDLDLMGVQPNTIYPDFERTSLYIRCKKFTWQDIDYQKK